MKQMIKIPNQRSLEDSLSFVCGNFPPGLTTSVTGNLTILSGGVGSGLPIGSYTPVNPIVPFVSASWSSWATAILDEKKAIIEVAIRHRFKFFKIFPPFDPSQ